jgi:hypothetical protein
MRFSRRTSLAVAILIAAAILADGPAQTPEAARTQESGDITVLYVGADDCPPCRVWQNAEGAAFRASPEFSRLTYREVKSPTLYDVLNDENWPDDLRRYRDRSDHRAGVPMWMVIARGNIVSRGFGPTQWRQSIWPTVRSLVR